MARFRRGNSLRPVNSIKHIIDTEGVWTDVTSLSPIAVAVPNVDTTTFKPGDIRVGATVNGFFLSIFAIGSTGAPVAGSINWYLIKVHGGAQINALPVPGQTGTSDIRNQIIHEEKGIPGSGDGTPMVFKGVIAIPRGMRRMREGDQWTIGAVSSVAGNDVNFCIKAIYKSYF